MPYQNPHYEAKRLWIFDAIEKFNNNDLADASHIHHDLPLTAEQDREIECHLYKLLYTTRQEMDAKRAGASFFIIDDAGHITWVRHFKSAENSAKIVAEEPDLDILNYARIAITYLIAYIKLIRLQNDDELLDSISDSALILAEQLCEAVANCQTEKEAKYLCHKFIDDNAIKPYTMYLRSQGQSDVKEADIEKTLDEIHNWVSLELPTMSIATVSTVTLTHPRKKVTLKNIRIPRIEHKRILKLAEPIVELSADYDQLFKHFEKHNWFTALTDLQQALFIHYLPKLREKNRVGPSQLRSILPIPRNVYRVKCIVEQWRDEFYLVADFIRTGTLVYLSHDMHIDMRTLSRIIFSSVNQTSGNHTLMFTLNSEWAADATMETINNLSNLMRSEAQNYVGDDRLIVEYTQAAADGDEKLHAANVGLNGFRAIEKYQLNGVNDIIQLTKKNVRRLKKISPSIKHEPIIQDIRKTISLLNRFTASSILRTITDPLDRHVNGLKIIYLTAQLKLHNDALVTRFGQNLDKPLHQFEVAFGCASGENRTQSLEFILEYFAATSLWGLYDITKPQLLTRDNMQSLSHQFAADGHNNISTGMQGGNHGAEGIRAKSAGSFPLNLMPNGLVQPYADIKDLRSLNTKVALQKQLDNAFDAFNDVEEIYKTVAQVSQIMLPDADFAADRHFFTTLIEKDNPEILRYRKQFNLLIHTLNALSQAAITYEALLGMHHSLPIDSKLSRYFIGLTQMLNFKSPGAGKFSRQHDANNPYPVSAKYSHYQSINRSLKFLGHNYLALITTAFQRQLDAHREPETTFHTHSSKPKGFIHKELFGDRFSDAAGPRFGKMFTADGALINAAKSGDFDKAEIALKSGARVNARAFGIENANRTALMIAIIENHPRILDLFLQMPWVQFHDMSLQTNHANAVVHTLAEHGNARTNQYAQQILDIAAQQDICLLFNENRFGKMPLEIAIENENWHLADMLVDTLLKNFLEASTEVKSLITNNLLRPKTLEIAASKNKMDYFYAILTALSQHLSASTAPQPVI